MITALVTSGCGGSGDGLPREAVSGTVTLNGTPLDKGSIFFNPTTSGEFPPTGGAIHDGRYQIDRGAGPVPGNYKVMISGGKEGPDHQLPGSPNPVPDRIPIKYNRATTLTAEIKAGQSNTFDFALTKPENDTSKVQPNKKRRIAK